MDLSCAVASGVSYCKSTNQNPFAAWNFPILTPNDFWSLGSTNEVSQAQLHYLCQFGLLGPTTHNTVPQRFRLLPGGILEVWLDRTFVLPASDVDGRQATISVGCVIAFIEIASQCYGLSFHTEFDSVPVTQTKTWEHQGPRYVRLARIHMQHGAQESLCFSWLHAIQKRRMVRAEYDRSAIPEGLAERMHSQIAKYPVHLHFLQDSASRFFMGKFQEIAYGTVMNRQAFARELGAWLLPDDSPSPVGMRGREFGLSEETTRRVHKGLLGEGPLLPNEVAAFAKTAGLGMRSASAVAVLTSPSDDTKHRLSAGQAYAELALLLQREGLSNGMEAGITEVTSASLALRSRLMTSQRPMVVFRLGRPLHSEDKLRPHSARPVLDRAFLPGGIQ